MKLIVELNNPKEAELLTHISRRFGKVSLEPSKEETTELKRPLQEYKIQLICEATVYQTVHVTARSKEEAYAIAHGTYEGNPENWRVSQVGEIVDYSVVE